MDYIFRKISSRLDAILAKGKSVLLLGPRQTGKTTLLKKTPHDRYITFADPRDRLRYEQEPGLLINEITALNEYKTNPLVIIDEVQKVPPIMDAVQWLIDNDIAQFILTGSSARKLKHTQHVNLLPGRVIPLYLSPLSLDELTEKPQDLHSLLVYGALPEIIQTTHPNDKEELLNAYVTLYLEEEIRLEALVRQVGKFARFLELAASESGHITNCSKLSQHIGVAHTTIREYYAILEDCLIAHPIEPLLKSKTRHRLSKSKRYLLFDLGLRRVAAKEGTQLSQQKMGLLFEQFVGLECLKQASFSREKISIKYWRDLNGPEVDWVIEKPSALIPIEVKYTDKPSLSDAKHLTVFLNDYDEATVGYIVCRTPHRIKLSDKIYALSWKDIADLFSS